MRKCNIFLISVAVPMPSPFPVAARAFCPAPGVDLTLPELRYCDQRINHLVSIFWEELLRYAYVVVARGLDGLLLSTEQRCLIDLLILSSFAQEPFANKYL